MLETIMDRTHLEEQEGKMLSPYAVLSKNSKGREFPITPCPFRTEYQRDRDRILHCKSFRRLQYKTQVFISPEGDHYRTRLTHTLEVSQIARSISRALRLNEDLCEAVALGHDLGHTPFGHIGERVLNSIEGISFRHNEQSLRIVEKLENGKGLNLTYEVRDGILNHRSSGNPQTLEAQVCNLSDKIAYLNHDIDDAIRAGIIREQDLPKECVAVLGGSHGERINTMIRDIVAESAEQPRVRMSDEVKQATAQLREYMFEKVYMDERAKEEEHKATYILTMLYHYYLEHPTEIANDYQEPNINQAVVDYLAGMSDRFAINSFTRLFVPRPWAK
ncbi:deoxyguanosinetriphosphate triphosphohydrolase [Clostridia bacterium OttesenSCG-928-F22]|nr:deoxyguanosinetriphosphate triphosphohydrolase [Clostridia bacterium OttesenSCG-928-F22]